MLNLLLALLSRSKGSAKAVQQVAGTLNKQLGKSSSFLNLVKTQQKHFPHMQKVDFLFNKKAQLDYLKRAFRKPSLREQWRRLTKWSTLKNAFITLSWDYIKKQYWFAKNQGGLLGPILSISKISEPVANARVTEQSILRRLTMTNKKRVTDRSPLNSSWLYFGIWEASTAQEDYWTGTLFYTVKHEKKDGSVRIGKTYTKHNFSLTSWSLMKAALGRDGTGAGTVWWKDKRGWVGGKEVKAGRWSEQVLISNRK